ncbi:MAG: protein-L-isoaspartate(D-aspartate) O-methyltransferase [Chloroflexi bacterium]|nr:protein-L-isoaspartate(D-aspartate) O-methyltransferase [Chloroflexota bacterium]
MDEAGFALERKRMVEEQIARRGIREPRLLAVMESLPRHLFVGEENLPWAYADGPLPIGHGQTISQPYIVALMTDMLHLAGTERVLEVGTGSGYQAAALGRMALEVHTVEIVPSLAERAGKLLVELGLDNVHVHTSDGSLGWPDAAPYDGILVAATAPRVPRPLLEQLQDGGRLALPVGSVSGYQALETWVRRGLEFDHEAGLPVAFVPLRGKHGWK